MGDLFEVKNNPQLNKDSFIFNREGEYPYFTRTVFNNGIAGYVDYLDEEHKITGGCLAVGMMGMQFFYMKEDFYAGQFTKRLIPKNFDLNEGIASFFIGILNKYKSTFKNVLVRNFEAEFRETVIRLPVKGEKIDFEFIDCFVAEIESKLIDDLGAYLVSTGLDDYILTNQEQEILDDFDNGKIAFGDFKYKDIFNNISQGKRLKKSDQVLGDIPFVMSGTTNTGVVNYVKNPKRSFPGNSITIDIFGNTFYRNYAYGAGDDTGVYWNDEKSYSIETMLFFAGAISKSILGKYSYGRKLRSSQSSNFTMKLPHKNGKPDYETMEIIISAVRKLVIKEIVLLANQEINDTNNFLNNN